MLCTSMYWYVLVCPGMYLWIEAMEALFWHFEGVTSGRGYSDIITSGAMRSRTMKGSVSMSIFIQSPVILCVLPSSKKFFILKTGIVIFILILPVVLYGRLLEHGFIAYSIRDHTSHCTYDWQEQSQNLRYRRF